jgi:hypothetical protein
MRSFAVIAGAIALLATPAAGSAQTRVGVYRGVGEYDLSGVDDGSVTAVRVSRGVLPFLSVEAGVAHVTLEQDFGGEMTLVQPELQAQLKLPLGLFAPYVGAGAGFAFASADGQQDDSELTLNAGLGLRVDLPFGLGVGVDGRLRGFGTDFTGSGADAVIGISYRF